MEHFIAVGDQRAQLHVGVTAHGQRRLHHHASIAQHFLARVAVQKIVRDITGDAQPDGKHQQQHQIEFKP